MFFLSINKLYNTIERKTELLSTYRDTVLNEGVFKHGGLGA